MMQLCNYAASVGCTECKHTLYKQCGKFVTAHAIKLSESIRPFKFDPKVRCAPSQVTWSRDVNVIKSHALRAALRLNKAIRKLSIHQVMSLALNNESVDDRIVFIDYSTKLSGDAEKIRGVLVSFIECLALHGAEIFVYVGPSIVFSNDYTKI